MNTHHPSTAMKVVVAILAVLFVLSLAWIIYGNYVAGSEPWQLVMSAVLLSVPLALLYFSIGLLAAAGQQKSTQGQISERTARLIYRTPRFAGVAIILFVGLFSLDVFTEGYSLWEVLGGFIMHSLPAILMALLLALAWRRPWLGFLAFAAAAVFFLRFVFSGRVEDVGIVLLFSGPMAAIALLFWADWKWLKAQHPAGKPG